MIVWSSRNGAPIFGILCVYVILFEATSATTTENNTKVSSSLSESAQRYTLYAFAAIGFLGFTCNVLVLITLAFVTCKHSIHFFVNLAVADSVSCLLLCFPAVLCEMAGSLLVPRAYCMGWQFIFVVFGACSIFQVATICLSRYFGVVKPMRRTTLMISNGTDKIIAALWLGSFILALPPLIWTIRLQVVGDHSRVSLFECHVNDTLWYVISVDVIMFVLPLCVMTECYRRVKREIDVRTQFIASGWLPAIIPTRFGHRARLVSRVLRVHHKGDTSPMVIRSNKVLSSSSNPENSPRVNSGSRLVKSGSGQATTIRKKISKGSSQRNDTLTPDITSATPSVTRQTSTEVSVLSKDTQSSKKHDSVLISKSTIHEGEIYNKALESQSCALLSEKSIQEPSQCDKLVLSDKGPHLTSPCPSQGREQNITSTSYSSQLNRLPQVSPPQLPTSTDLNNTYQQSARAQARTSSVPSLGEKSKLRTMTRQLLARSKPWGICHQKCAALPTPKCTKTGSKRNIKNRSSTEKTSRVPSRSQSCPAHGRFNNSEYSIRSRRISGSSIQVASSAVISRPGSTWWKKNKTNMTLSSIVALMVLFWMPFFLFLPMCYAHRKGGISWVTEKYCTVTSWVGLCHSLANPFLYALAKSGYRKTLYAILRCKRPKTRRIAPR